MSSFCSVISKSKDLKEFPSDQKENQNPSDPDTEEDFERNSHYIKDRDLTINKNLDGIMQLKGEVQQYAAVIRALEAELERQDRTLAAITHAVAEIEDCTRKLPSPEAFQSDCAAVVGLVESLDSKMANTSADVELLNALNAAEDKLGESPNNGRVLTSIMSLHMDLLENMERKVLSLNQTCDAVDQKLQVINEAQQAMDQLFKDPPTN